MQVIFLRGGNGRESKGIFFCHARDFLSDLVEAGWPSGKDTSSLQCFLPAPYKRMQSVNNTRAFLKRRQMSNTSYLLWR